MRRSSACLLSVTALACLGLSVTSASADAPPDGKALYEKNCSSCHGMDGSADTPAGQALQAAHLKDPKYASIDAAEVTKDLRERPQHAAVSPMVSDAQIEAITAHIHELGGGSAQPGADAPK
jgi:mono/diheme cytochrome c family protein